jgi:hypothetical protein
MRWTGETQSSWNDITQSQKNVRPAKKSLNTRSDAMIIAVTHVRPPKPMWREVERAEKVKNTLVCNVEKTLTLANTVASHATMNTRTQHS